jgi:hypothetical protein
MKAQNILQWCAIFFVSNTVRMPLKHTENFGMPFEMTEFQQQNPFAGIKCFLQPEPLLKTSSAADDHQQHGQITTLHA